MSKAEVMIIAMLAALHYRGNFAPACEALREQDYMPRMVSASRFNRRLHRIKPLFLIFFAVLREEFSRRNLRQFARTTPAQIHSCRHATMLRTKDRPLYSCS
jgi:hypothetical protein